MIPARQMNEAFASRLNSPEGKAKLAEYGGNYIRDKLREVSFARQVLPPEQVTRADCQRSVNHDTLTKIVEVEPQSRAMAVSFRGEPTSRFIYGERFEVAFFTIASEQFQKNEQELLAYEMPITKIIEENSVKDIQEIEDREFTLHVEAAVQTLQTEANGGTPTELSSTTIQSGSVVETSIRKGEIARAHSGTPTATVYPLQRPDIVELFKLLDGNRLRADRLLLTEVDWDDLLQWTVEDFGDKLQSETAVEGYKHNTVLGKGYIRTIKTDILRPGNIYCFTTPEFLGRFYILNNTKFYIDKVYNMISFQSWEDIAMAIGNIASVRKMELYPCDANPTTDGQSLAASFRPLEEEALGAVNNRVGSGLYFPQVVSY